MYDELDRYLDAKEATADAAIAREEADFKRWCADLPESELAERRADFINFNPEMKAAWIAYLRAEYDEVMG